MLGTPYRPTEVRDAFPRSAARPRGCSRPRSPAPRTGGGVRRVDRPVATARRPARGADHPLRLPRSGRGRTAPAPRRVATVPTPVLAHVVPAARLLRRHYRVP